MEELGKHHYVEALKLYERAAALDPRDDEAYIGQGVAHTGLEQFSEAAQAYDRALALKADEPASYMGRGKARLRLADAQGALADFERAVELNSGLIHQVRGEQGTARWLLRDYAGAVRDLTLALDDGVDDPAQLLFSRADALSHLHQPARAVADCRRLLQLEPDDLEGCWLLARVELEAGNSDAALRDARRALKINSKSAEAHDVMGQILQARQDRSGAAACFRRAVRFAPDSPTYRAHLRAVQTTNR